MGFSFAELALLNSIKNDKARADVERQLRGKSAPISTAPRAKYGSVKASRVARERQREIAWESSLEAQWLRRWQAVSDIEPVRQLQPIPGRKFAFDFAFPAHRVLIEVNGGTWAKKRTGHSTGAGISRDAEKSNLAQAAGWRVFTFTADAIAKENGFLGLAKLINEKAKV